MFDKLQNIIRQLYPTGRAFRIPFSGVFDKLHTAFNVVEANTVNDSLSIFNVILADNDNFTEEDATDWEIRLGMIVDSGALLEDRKAAILRKYNHPGTISARQNYRYVERELRAAGFDVYVYENRFADGGGYITKTPSEVGFTGDELQLGMIQLGGGQLGEERIDRVANSINSDVDVNFNAGSVLRRTFFVSGNPITSSANIDANREIEFRDLIMKLKPVQTVAWLNINYV